MLTDRQTFRVHATALRECIGLLSGVVRGVADLWLPQLQQHKESWHNKIHPICTKNLAAELLELFHILEVPGLNFEPQTDSSDMFSRYYSVLQG
jgi:hypothetical protein